MSTFSESTTIETPIIQMLTKLGYTYTNGYDENIHSSCFGRETTKDVLLFDELHQAVQRLNPQYSSDIHLAAINELREIGLNKTTAQANKDAYNLMRDGAKIQMTNGNGDRETVTIKFFDFEDPENNDFLVVNQFSIQGDFYTRRPDILVFVNGIPLVQIELKKPTVSIEKAYEDNLQDYINTIPQLYRYNAFVILSN
ncbi:MAG: type I restriction endonuclease [bacterium]